MREVDLLIAVPGGLFLIEIKSHPGRATNRGGTWLFRAPDRTRSIDNPLHLTDRKSKELKNRLEWAAGKLRVREPVPFIEPAVFLSAPGLRSELDEQAAGPRCTGVTTVRPGCRRSGMICSLCRRRPSGSG
ncbi:nuclease-related domain-containing protein [Salinispora arenicola]|uniref:nuclease-related domain-containing protein n=1 Tax=Salinispora arenicola TaxID=168697 RepID=UPI0027DC24BE|nr:nuclease-related domain-containing protein [Salinispora arenicola]